MSSRLSQWTLLCCLCAPLVPAAASSGFDNIIGLYKDRVVIRTANGDQLITVGDQTPAGAVLVFSNSERAQLEFEGRLYDVSMTRRVQGDFAEMKVQGTPVHADSSE